MLIGNDALARAGIVSVRDKLVAARRLEGGDDMASHRERLIRGASEFLKLAPA